MPPLRMDCCLSAGSCVSVLMLSLVGYFSNPVPSFLAFIAMAFANDVNFESALNKLGFPRHENVEEDENSVESFLLTFIPIPRPSFQALALPRPSCSRR